MDARILLRTCDVLVFSLCAIADLLRTVIVIACRLSLLDGVLSDLRHFLGRLGRTDSLLFCRGFLLLWRGHGEYAEVADGTYACRRACGGRQALLDIIDAILVLHLVVRLLLELLLFALLALLLLIFLRLGRRLLGLRLGMDCVEDRGWRRLWCQGGKAGTLWREDQGVLIETQLQIATLCLLRILLVSGFIRIRWKLILSLVDEDVVDVEHALPGGKRHRPLVVLLHLGDL